MSYRVVIRYIGGGTWRSGPYVCRKWAEDAAQRYRLHHPSWRVEVEVAS